MNDHEYRRLRTGIAHIQGTLDPDPLTVYPEPDTDDEPWRVPDWPRPADFDRMTRAEFAAYMERTGFDARIRAALTEPLPDARRWWALAIAAVVLFVIAVAWSRWP